MKTLAALSLALVAYPALADTSNFTGPRVGATVGLDDVTNSPDTNDVVYGADVGVDVPLTGNFVVGVEAFSTNPFETTRTVGAAARLGYAVTPNVMPYVRAGYSNYQDVLSRELDGLTVGGGVEYAFNSKLYAKVEYRYSDFEKDIGNHSALVGVGIRF